MTFLIILFIVACFNGLKVSTVFISIAIYLVLYFILKVITDNI